MNEQGVYTYIVRPYKSSVDDMFEKMGGFKRVYDEEDADILIIPGGPDLNPEFYSDTMTRAINMTKSKSIERAEYGLISRFVKKKKRIIGICRGAQQLCVAAGGHLIQDFRGHSYADHNMYFIDGSEHLVNSRHHQMMFPFNLEKDEYSVLGWDHQKGNNHYKVGEIIDKKEGGFSMPYVKKYFYEAYTEALKSKDESLSHVGIINPKNAPRELLVNEVMHPEIVLFHRIGGLAIQFHPEDMTGREYSGAMENLISIIEAFLDDKF